MWIFTKFVTICNTFTKHVSTFFTTLFFEKSREIFPEKKSEISEIIQNLINIQTKTTQAMERISFNQIQLEEKISSLQVSEELLKQGLIKTLSGLQKILNNQVMLQRHVTTHSKFLNLGVDKVNENVSETSLISGQKLNDLFLQNHEISEALLKTTDQVAEILRIVGS